MSTTQSWFGASTVKSLSTRSSAGGVPSETEVAHHLSRLAPTRPAWRVSRATRLRPTWTVAPRVRPYQRDEVTTETHPP